MGTQQERADIKHYPRYIYIRKEFVIAITLEMTKKAKLKIEDRIECLLFY